MKSKAPEQLTKEQLEKLPKRHAMAIRILAWVTARGKKGATLQEAVNDLRLKYNSGSARFSNLKSSGCIIPNGERRKTKNPDGTETGFADVMVANPDKSFWDYMKSSKRAVKVPANNDLTIIRVVRRFQQEWLKAETKPRQKRLIVSLVERLVTPAP